MPVDEEDLDDRELPDRADMDQDDDTVLSRCPACKKMIYEQSEVCPKCGTYIYSNEPAKPYPLWIIIVIVLALIAMVFDWKY